MMTMPVSYIKNSTELGGVVLKSPASNFKPGSICLQTLPSSPCGQHRDAKYYLLNSQRFLSYLAEPLPEAPTQRKAQDSCTCKEGMKLTAGPFNPRAKAMVDSFLMLLGEANEKKKKMKENVLASPHRY